MDVHMPIMDGYRATELIRGLGLVLPIIGLTADARSSERKRAFDAGMNAFVAKPFDPAALVRCIQEHLAPGISIQSAHSVTPLQSTPAEHGWPELSGIDTAEARNRLFDDRALFRMLLFRLLDEFADLAPPEDFSDVRELAQYAARMHKLRGAAGQLGARSIHDLAARLEEGVGGGEPERTVMLAQTLTLQLKELRLSAESQFELALIELPAAAASTPEPRHLSQLLELLREQNLRALEQVEGIYPWARKTWGDQLEPFVHHIQNLRFVEAATILEAHIPAGP